MLDFKGAFQLQNGSVRRQVSRQREDLGSVSFCSSDLGSSGCGQVKSNGLSLESLCGQNTEEASEHRKSFDWKRGNTCQSYK